MKDNKNLVLSCLYNETILQTSGTTGMTELTFVPSIDRAGVEAWGGVQITGRGQKIPSSFHFIHELQGLGVTQRTGVGILS